VVVHAPVTNSPTPAARVIAVLDHPTARKTALLLAGIIGFYWVQQRLWPAPKGVLVQGVVIGGLTALISFGISLVYRANRIINFAQGELGAIPASLTVLLIVGPGLPYVLAVPIGIVAAVALGAAVEFLLIRRFFKASRLILTVITIGVSQLLAGLGFLLPRAFDINTPPQSFPSPFDFRFRIGQTAFTGNDIIAMLAVPACIAALVLFFRYTNVGVAVRASAESADRASLLGVPVKRLETIVWVIAALLSAIAVFLRAGIVGLPFGQLLAPAILVRALAACVIGRMDRLPTIFVASVALGILESAIVFSTGRAVLLDPILFVVITIALFFQRRSRVARGDEAAGLQLARDPRPIPRELARVPEVVWGVRAAIGVPVLIALGLPLVMDESRISLAAVIVITAMVAVSLVVLTGWAGQVSLGQVGFMGVGAATSGYMTTRWGWDLGVACIAASLIGAAVAIVIGIPALRIKGLLLSVTTLSFALAMSSWVLNESYFGWLPTDRFERPLLFGAISLEGETRYYYFSVAALVITVMMVRGLHRSRTGRVLVALRDNERAAQAFGVRATAAKLIAFAISGFIAAFAGAVFVHHDQALGREAYTIGKSFTIFVIAVIGGLGSVPGAILGAVFIVGVEYFKDIFPAAIAGTLTFLTGGVGLIFVLLALPGGLSQAIYGVRDKGLRFVAERRGIVVPSLLADSRQVETSGPPALDPSSGDGDPAPDVERELVGAAVGAPPRRRRRGAATAVQDNLDITAGGGLS
jgi:branched-chain amino acid transport system permease protein